MSKNRAFVRYNKKGILAPGSLVVTKNYPDRSQNLWYEVPTNLLGSTTILETGLYMPSLPWVYNPSIYKAIELGMGCMSNTADWMNVYCPLTEDITTADQLVSILNTRMSFLGTFELGKLDGDYQTIIFNLSSQLATDLNKPIDASPNYCGFGISLYID
jgi:hypothetical protein